MQTLYDSESFVVMHFLASAVPPLEGAHADAAALPPQMPRNGFEIVDKRSGKELYLDGTWAELFQRQILAWKQHAPSQEEVEDTLEGYATLAQTRVCIH